LREERAALDEEGNKLAKVSKDADEYLKLNKEVAELDKAIAKAEARGEDTEYLEGKRTTAASRIDSIAPAVEKAFPDLTKQRVIPKREKAPTSGVVKGFTPPTTETGLPPAATTPVPAPTPTPTQLPGTAEAQAYLSAVVSAGGTGITAPVSAATITPTADACDQYEVTALATTGTFDTPSGTPTDGQKLILRIKDNGSAQTMGWTTTAGGYRAVGVVLPTTTVISSVLYVGCIYNAQDGYWDAVTTVQL